MPPPLRSTIRRLVVVVLTALALVGSACGSDDDDNPALEQGPPPAAHNDADVAFAQGMVPHHEQAIEMSDLAPKRASSAKLKDLANRIKAAQGPEIEKMKGWLRDWNQPLSAGGGEHAGMHTQGGMGMMSDAEMKKLEAASGTGFDRLFLEGMIRHHEGAVSMAKEEQAKGMFAEAKALAGQIVASQEAEISEMRGLLAAFR